MDEELKRKLEAKGVSLQTSYHLHMIGSRAMDEDTRKRRGQIIRRQISKFWLPIVLMIGGLYWLIYTIGVWGDASILKRIVGVPVLMIIIGGLWILEEMRP